MDNLEVTCPKCKNRMEQGFIPDVSYGAYALSYWYKGKPKKSLLSGIFAPKADRITLSACRCPSCGFVELYSNEEFKAI